MMLKGKKNPAAKMISWRLFLIALAMTVAAIWAMGSISQKAALKNIPNPDPSGPERAGYSSMDDSCGFSSAAFRICEAHGVPPRLVQAIIQVESQGNPKAVSRKGAMGLMQLMPEMIRLYQLVDPFDPLENIEAGVRHLKYLLTEFSGNLALTLAAYNAGPKAVRKYQGIPPYPETKDYLRKVLMEYNREERRGEFWTAFKEEDLKTRASRREKKFIAPEPPQFFAFFSPLKPRPGNAASP